jgi:site-specific DNA-methyltransferase (adenine-specific)
MEKLKMEYKVICGNNVDLLKIFPDNHFDSIVTDPPYGLGKEPIASDLMKDWIEKGYHEISGSGFMGKEWDAFVPQPIFWIEVFRVLKPGCHVLAFYGTRTYDWGVMAMRFAGFEVRDCIQWLYGSGFPKSHNISKALDKMEGAEREVIGKKERGSVEEAKERGVGFLSDPANRNNTKQFGYGTELITAPSTDSAKQWDGWGTALKPANEPIVLARKPLEKGLSIAENILKWGVGGINIDASRIGLTDKDNKDNGRVINRNIRESEDGWGMQDNKADRVEVLSNQGRFPANIILTHHEDCECKGTKKVKAIKGGNSGTIGNEVYGKFNGEKNNDGCGFGDENGQEEVENWDCHEDCPIRILDEQSGVSKSSNTKRNRNTLGSFGMPNDETPEYNDKGGASRFFYVAKASKSERNKGLEEFDTKQTQGGGGGIGDYEDDVNSASGKYGSEKAPNKNFHPTVKPIKLMQYLVKLITPPNGIVLDPFCGSGTTGVACKLDGFQFVGLEQDPEYFRIAEARINNINVEIESQLKLF